MAQRRDRADLATLVANLPERYRNAIVLRYVEDLKVEEVIEREPGWFVVRKHAGEARVGQPADRAEELGERRAAAGRALAMGDQDEQRQVGGALDDVSDETSRVG